MYYVGLFCFCIVHVRAFVVLFDLRPVPSSPHTNYKLKYLNVK
jgi:hypothetical protein